VLIRFYVIVLVISGSSAYAATKSLQDTVKHVEVRVNVRSKSLGGFEPDSSAYTFSIPSIPKKKHAFNKKTRNSKTQSHKIAGPDSSNTGDTAWKNSDQLKALQKADAEKNEASKAGNTRHTTYLLVALALIFIGCVLGFFYRSSFWIPALGIILIIIAYYLIVSSLLFLN